MNKTAIKNFAIWARQKLIGDIIYKAGILGINEKGIAKPLDISTGNVQFFDIGIGKPTAISDEQIKQRDALVRRIREKESTSDYKTAYQYVVEEVAYTWFNRLIAIRFMEVNDYLPSRVRVLSSEIEGKTEPDMVTSPFDTDMEFSPYEKDRIIQLKDENKLDELFRMLLIKQCNKLNEVLPELFEKTSDYTESLLNISFTDKEGIVNHLANDIEEKDFTDEVQIIGWLYQYYNTEPKEEVFTLLKKNVKITKERIPAATQLFTPDWIVRYMVENSLGRLWIERERAISKVSDEYLNGSYFGWKYYLEEAEQEEKVSIELEKIRSEYKNLNPEDIKVIDPCMGSGHILVYAFDMLMQIYENQGYTQRDAVQSIVENNLHGLDIDDRAYQLAYFAVMMKARKYDRRFLTREISPRLYSIQESNNISKTYLQYYGSNLNELERNIAIKQMEYLLDSYHDAKEYGSILNIDTCDWELLNKFAEDYNTEGQVSLESFGAEKSQDGLKELVSIAETMSQKYDIVITNPPYMGGSGMNAKLSEFLKYNYAITKTDLFAAFIEKGNRMTKYNCYNCMVTMQSWMFLSSFQKMREDILNTKTISNLLHMDNMVMGIAFGTAVTNIRNVIIEEYKGTYNQIKLKDIDIEKPREFPVRDNRFAQISAENFSKIPGAPIAYWVSENLSRNFNNPSLSKYVNCKSGIMTGDDKFVKLWYELNINHIKFDCKSDRDMGNYKWFPLNSGGEYRNWYGNNEKVVDLWNNGTNIKSSVKNFRLREKKYYFKKGITWGRITSSNIAFREVTGGSLFGDAGPIAFVDNHRRYFLGLLCSKVVGAMLKATNPTLNYQIHDIMNIPVILSESGQYVENLVSNNVDISKTDWDFFETSWDFQTHPLIQFRMAGSYAWGDAKPVSRISSAFKAWEMYAEEQFYKLKSNEEELNRIFIDIYGLQDELTPEVEDKDVTVRKADLTRDIKSFISYAVGCMFGRYSFDVEGLAYAGGEWDENKYTTFIPVKDNCIPITDEEYLKNDIVGLFAAFVKKVYGDETLEENLDFIAKALGNKGDTSKEIIRNYFIKDFYKDHVKIYQKIHQKRPIYWLYDSGKQDGFKALIYMHRYNSDTTGMVRVDYLHKIQKIYTNEIDRMQDIIENSSQAREVAQAEKRKEKLIKQLKETKEYDEKIAHIALSRIEIDLDDGVKVNYDKVQTARDGKKLNILGKI